MPTGFQASSAFATAMGLVVVACALAAAIALIRSRRLEKNASIDELTGLINRAGLTAKLADWPTGRPAALILVDVDHFSELNEAFGQAVGDQVLVALAGRVKSLSADGPVARWGSDEFAIVVPHVSGREALGELADAVGRSLQEPITIGAVEISLATHVAAGGWPFQATDWNELFGKVDLALRRAKNSWKRTVVYDPKPDAKSVQRLALVGELRRAIDGDELRLRYQPRIRLADGAVVGAEALVRWQHPKRGLLGPGAFIPAAEAAGLVGALTRRVLAIAVADAAGWRAEGWHLSVSVNLSPQDLGDVGLATYVEDLLDTHGLPPELLTLEVTESAFMADASFGAELLENLTRRGVTVAIDDFGTGYSSLARVATMPAKELKIDQGFVADIWSAGSAAVVRATIDLAHSLNMIVVAEGIETSEQYTQLVEYGCDDAQGFWLGKPMALRQFLSEAKRWDSDKRSVRVSAEPDESSTPDMLIEPLVATVDVAQPESGTPRKWWAAINRAFGGPGAIAAAAAAAFVALAASWLLVGGNAVLATGPVAVAAAVACGWASTRTGSHTAGALRLLAVAAAVFGVGVRVPAVNVVACALAGAAVLAFPHARERNRRERVQLLLDVGTMAMAGAAAVWLATIGPQLRDGGALGHQLAVIVPAVADVVLFVLLAFVTLRGVATGDALAARWISAGLAGIVLADGFGISRSAATVAGFAAVALGAFTSGRQHVTDDSVQRESTDAPAAWLPHVGAAAVAALLLGATAANGVPLYPVGGLLFAVVVVTALVTVRQVLGLRESLSLVGQFAMLARTDPLTGLANRKRLMEEGERLFERSGRDGSPMAALLVDVDYFKLANDRHGHAVGDVILQHVAGLCSQNVRTGDLVGRHGGDEVVILLANADVAVAEAMAHRFNRLAADFTPDGLDYTLTVSIGVADNTSAASLGGLIRNADRALHDAKKAGRNQTAVFREPLFAAS